MQYKSRRAKATDIPMKVKETVYERDGGRCIVCGKQGMPNAHYIRRSQGGLGIEQNVVTLCTTCHNDFDNGKYRDEIGSIIKDYLEHYYKDWDEKKLVYNKYGERKNYGNL